MTFRFLFTFIVSAKGLPCAVASKAAGQVVGSPGLLSARLHALHGQMASAFHLVWCLLSALGRQLGLLASPSTGWTEGLRSGCAVIQLGWADAQICLCNLFWLTGSCPSSKTPSPLAPRLLTEQGNSRIWFCITRLPIQELTWHSLVCCSPSVTAR